MTMNKPNAKYPIAPTTTLAPFPIQLPDPSMRAVNFDQILNRRGVRFFHQKATPCPNMTSLDASNHIPACPHCSGNGYLYYDTREIFGVFYSNSLENIYEPQGTWELGTTVITFPNIYYIDGEPTNDVADFGTFDKLFMPDFEIRLWEMVEFEKASTGLSTTKLHYPVTKIDLLVAVDSSQNLITYELGVDFNIDNNGLIEWIAGKEPPYNAEKEIGEVLSVSYYANPVYNVVQLLHDTRVTQEMNSNGEKVATRLPQSVLVKRDFLVSDPGPSVP